MPNPVRVAIETRLKNTPAVVALLSNAGAVYHRRAPQTAKPPVIIFDKRSGFSAYTMGGDNTPVLDETWIVRGVAFGRTADRAEDIAAAIDAALTDAPLQLSGKRLLAVYRDSDVSYTEQVGREMFQHEGAMYRVFSQAP